ncbi:hypothetical protein GGQ80_003546 [Sphingomonas jinjuensis]|uniref:Uncharacterized protein n=1 Tax=Sphingomonas jinjuensis TaxID=535907 RepID=A0A840FFG2_9SPHN|nr:hypothetical protein [Sphingomonas jinjuensis]MBB4155621.1 hypothetical protein [Sphingomonas jinjuensis]
MATAHQDRVREFTDALIARENERVLDEFYHVRPAVMLEAGAEAELRRSIAVKLGVEMRDVMITGSAKIGFTLVGKAGRPPLSQFGDASDIDVAVISSRLFVDLWQSSFLHFQDYGDWNNSNSFRKYLARGWMRPDKLPRSSDFPQQREWFDFFQSLTANGKFGPYKISGGVYYNELFWKGYASAGLNICRNGIGTLA